MSNGQIGMVILIVITMVAGQVLFKVASQYLVIEKGPISFIFSLFTWQFISALILYTISTFVWIILLKYVPLNRAHPFMALSFVLLPILFCFWRNPKFSFFSGYIVCYRRPLLNSNQLKV
jgi:hypothetical protein